MMPIQLLENYFASDYKAVILAYLYLIIFFLPIICIFGFSESHFDLYFKFHKVSWYFNDQKKWSSGCQKCDGILILFLA